MRQDPNRSVLLLLALCCLTPDTGYAQQRKQFLDGLVKTLIDNRLPDSREQQRAGSDSNANPQGTRARVQHSASPELREAGRLLARASDEMSRLVGALQADIFRAQGVRQLLTLAMNINADAAVLSRRLNRAHDVEPLREGLRQLDQDWRTLDYHLGQTPNLSRQTLGHIEVIRQYERQLAAMFEVAPQINLQEIVRETTEMGQLLRRLIEQIPYEVTDRSLASRLDAEGRGVFELLRRFLQQAQLSTSYDQLREEFETFQRQWDRFNRGLRRTNSRYVLRQAQQIDSLARSIHEMFWIEKQVNYDDLLYTTRLLQEDTHKLLERVTLGMLVDHPGARNFAVPSAADFDTLCHDLEDVMVAQDDLDVIQELYVYAHDEWMRLNMALQGVTAQPVRQAVRDIQRSLSDLKTMLGVRPDFDRQRAIEVTAWVAGMARNLQDDIRDVFARPNRYSRQFQTQSLEAAARFSGSSKQLHADLANGEKIRLVKEDCTTLARDWEQLSVLVPNFGGNDQRQLVELRRQITPKVVELQTLLAL